MTARLVARVATVLACTSLLEPRAASAQNIEALHLAVWRRSTEFSYIRQYFPSRQIDFQVEKQMTSGEIKSTTAALTRAVNDRGKAARLGMPGIRVLLGNKMSSSISDLPATLKIDVRDDGEIWFHNDPPGTVVISPRTVRGLMKGSLQSLRVDLPQPTSSWDDSPTRTSFFGSDLLGNDSASLTDDQWDLRFAKLMTVIERAKIRSMVGTAWRMITGDDDDDFDDDEFDFEDADDYISGEVKMSVVVGLQLGAALTEFSEHYLAAERFMLAHELGHLALRNNPQEKTSCADAQKAEDDADSFAIALLMMDDSAGTAVISANNSIKSMQEIGLQGAGLKASMGLGDDDYSVVYGYRDFTKFVYRAAEFSGQVTAKCAYRKPEDRQAFIDRLRQSFFERRKAAFDVIQQHLQHYPPTLSVTISGSVGRNEDLYANMGADKKCAGVEQKRGSRRVTIDSGAGDDSSEMKATEYSIKCKWPVPQPSIMTPEQLALVGPTVWNNFVKAYGI